MFFTLEPLRWADAWAMRSWHYKDPYALYDLKLFPLQFCALRPLYIALGHKIYAVRNEDQELAGLFRFSQLSHQSLDIGLGLRPDLTGRGYGLAFMQAGLEYGQACFAPTSFQLTVASFNQRAITVYRRAGFHKVREVLRFSTRGGYRLVWEMRREATPAPAPHR